MKNILKNKYKFFTVLAAVTILFASCSNGNQTKNPELSQGKARISFGVEDSSRAVVSKLYASPLDLETDITKIQLKIVGQAEIIQIFTSDASESAYSKFTAYTVELDYGTYDFYLELSDDSTTYMKAKEEAFDVTFTSKKITLNAYYVTNGQLKLSFADGTNDYAFSKVKLYLYDQLPAASVTPIDSKVIEMSTDGSFPAYEKTDLAPGDYFLRYEVYCGLKTGILFDENDNPIFDDYGDLLPKIEDVLLNTFGPVIVEINGNKTQGQINIETGEVNTLPDYSGGTFGLYDPEIEIEVIEESDIFYLNNGTIAVKGKNTTTGEFNGSLSAKLYFNGQEVLYTAGVSNSSSFSFSLLKDKPLLAGGLYKLVILAKEIVQQDSGTTYYYASRAIDFEVEGKEYYEFNLEDESKYYCDSGWNTLKTDIIALLSNTRNNVELKLYGQAFGGETNIADWWRALRDSLKNSGSCKVDLDMREVGGLIGITNFANEDEYYMLRSIKLPVETYSITSNAFFGQAALQNIYIYCSTPSDSMQTAYPGIELDIEEQAFAGLRALQKIEIEKVTPDAPCRYQTYADGKLLVKNTADGAMVLAATPDLKTFDLSTCDNTVTAIGAYAFSNTNIQTLTGTENLETIGEGAFRNTKALASIDLGGVTEIPDYAFMDSGIQSVIINNVTTIGDWGFMNAEALTTIDIPEVTEIKGRAFDGSGLETITSTSKLTTIGDSAFKESKLTVFPDLTNVTSIAGYAFYGCKNFQTITVDDAFLDLIDNGLIGYNTLTYSATQNMIIDCEFKPTVTLKEGTAESYQYDTTWDTRRAVINSCFVIKDTLTFNEEAVLPDLTPYGDIPQSISDQFFSNSQGGSSEAESGLKHVVFRKKTKVGIAQFSKFKWLQSIEFLDEDSENASEIGKQAFWINPNDSKKLYVTRSADDIVLTGVKKIAFNVINYINGGGTLVIPESVIAINTGSFKGITTTGANAVTPSFTSASTDKWIKVSTVNINNGHTAEPVINGWLQSKPTTLPAADAGSAGSTDPQEVPKAKIELQKTVNGELVDIVPQFSDFMEGVGAYDQEIWYYRYTNYTGN